MRLARTPAADPIEAFDDLIGLMRASLAEILRMIVVFDREERWRPDGATCMAAWLVARYGVAWGTAREWVRVAHALRSLPRVAAAHAEGRLSWDQLRPVTKIATPETDEYWARRGPSLKPRTLHREVERHERVLRHDAEEARRRRSFSMRWDREGSAPVLYLAGALPGVQGAAFEEALRHRALGVEVEEDVVDAREARNADALVAAVTGASEGAARPPTLVVHVAAEAILGGETEDGPVLAETASGIRVASDEVRGLLDAARVEWVLEREGRPIGVGRTSRRPPGWLARLVEFRDGARCVFPGCERRGYPDQHHVQWWKDGGATDLDNLIVMCDEHHRLIHKGGWTIHGHPGGLLRFHDPGGRPLPDEPPSIRPEIRERYFP